MIRHLALDKAQASYIQQVFVQVAAALPWATTHHHQTRCFAHLAISSLPEHFSNPPLFPEDPVCSLLAKFKAFTTTNAAAARLLQACKPVLQPHAWGLGDVTTVMSGGGALAGESAGSDTLLLEAAPKPLMDAILDFLTTERHKMRRGGDGGGVPGPKYPRACTHSCVVMGVRDVQAMCYGSINQEICVGA
jgi:hypothetical protein